MEQPQLLLSRRNEGFCPKEYKIEIAVFNLLKGRIMLVFPALQKLTILRDCWQVLEAMTTLCSAPWRTKRFYKTTE